MSHERQHLEAYAADFARAEEGLSRALIPSLRGIRRSAMDQFLRTGFPTTRQEAWRFTDLQGIARTRFLPASTGVVDPALLAPFEGPRLVCVNGRLDVDLSRAGSAGGIDLCGLEEAARRFPEEIEGHLARVADPAQHPFVALNTAFLADGIFLRIGRSASLREPIHLIHATVGAGDPVLSQPRVVLLAQEGAQAAVVETFLAPGGSPSFTNAVTEIVLGPSAVLEHCRVLGPSATGFHLGSVAVRQLRDSRYVSHSVTLGGTLVRNDLAVALAEEGASCTLNGLYVAGGASHVDNQTCVRHVRAHATSVELYKGILDGRASAVFNGRIRVDKGAQKTDARQSNRNLLLSGDATVHTQPQLEILADDVKCSHGATIGQIESEAVFYLRSRGIGEKAARSILVRAFAREMVDRVRDDRTRGLVERELAKVLPEGP